MHVVDVLFRRLRRRMTDSFAPTNQLNLLQWFPIVSFLLISVIAFGLGSMAARFLVSESLEQDALHSGGSLPCVVSR